jgi:hypothetical protein
VQLLPDCAPHSISYILELLASRHCVGCHFYRAESRGKSWDPEGNPIEHVRSKYQVLSRPIEEPGCLPIDKVPCLAWDFHNFRKNYLEQE